VTGHISIHALSPDRIAADAMARATLIWATKDPFDWQPHGDPPIRDLKVLNGHQT
jgi:hypothetical protein